MQQVRLSPEQISVIKQSFEKRFLKGDRLWIFGSRANMSKKGGDIDIYIETNAQSLDDALKMKQNLYVDLQIG